MDLDQSVSEGYEEDDSIGKFTTTHDSISTIGHEQTKDCQMNTTNPSQPLSLKPTDQLTLSSYFTTEKSVSDDPFDSVYGQSGYTETTTGSNSLPTVFNESSNTVESAQSSDATSLNRWRQRDAWLPSESTRLALLLPEPSRETTQILPKLSAANVDVEGSPVTTDFTQTDSYRTVLLQYLKDEATVASIRQIPNLTEQTGQTTERLKELIVWLTRLALLIRTRNYEIAERELASFHNLDSPNVYYDYYQSSNYHGRTGSIIPFSLRLLHAELPFYLNRSDEALDRLYYLLAIIGRIQSNLYKGYTEDGSMLRPEPDYRTSSLCLWACREVRVLSSCLSIFMDQVDYQAAIETVHRLSIVCAANPAVLRGLASILGRIHLQMGDLESAKAFFAKSVTTDDPRHTTMSNQHLFQKALLCLGKNEYEEAKSLFQQVLVSDPTNVAAVNNMVVCSLYLGQLPGAINVLTTLTTSGLCGQTLDTASHLTTGNSHTQQQREKMASHSTLAGGSLQRRRFCLHDALVFNLSVLFEVESDQAVAKKVKLLERLSSLPGEPVHISAFKLH